MSDPLHVVSLHDGAEWLGDDLIEGDPGGKIIELLGGLPDRDVELMKGLSRVYYRGQRVALVMTLGPEVDRARAAEIMVDIREGREDTN